ncbi:protein maelstrom homolog isoform X1 [Neodiprion pinetum]|uniref:Protein maelstrom homolog isoform X1 n=1 Tax=Neodiprion lecontei TaxID=441921 RepID=A0A6J0C6V8_NEOLC|nr:protein maelstrom homolog isoform X1 [Neodiprion lecontei]XP_046482789.1 protein maelstrom homolog isoform X1 [Neodiprion pinetum]
MPKKQQHNAFYFFMQDFRKTQETQGKKFPGGLQEIATVCSPEWQKMTDQQKGPYEARAKNAKVKSGISGMKYTSQGVPITLIEKEAKRKQEFEDNMNDYIKMTVNMTDHIDELISKKFYFIHVNWLCRKLLPNGEGDFYPIEFAVAEFSLKDGVAKPYHEIIDLDVPMGYASDALQHSEATHKISPNPPGGEKNFSIMYQRLRNLLEPETIGDELPPLYTTRGVMEIVPGLLSRMAKTVGQTADMFRVYSLETLFFHIRNTAASKIDTVGFPALTIAEDQIHRDIFDYVSGIACDYHQNIDGATMHCSLSVVIRWAYTICDFCCLDVGIEMKPGAHCPLNTDMDRIRDLKEKRESDMDNLMAESVNRIRSMTGVTEEHRVKTSARTYKEDQERRQNFQPLKIIDHSKLLNSNVPDNKCDPNAPSTSIQSTSTFAQKKVERPLRLPRGPSFAMSVSDTEKVPSMDHMNFPAIGGRGINLRKASTEKFPPIGRGRGGTFDN